MSQKKIVIKARTVNKVSCEIETENHIPLTHIDPLHFRSLTAWEEKTVELKNGSTIKKNMPKYDLKAGIEYLNQYLMIVYDTQPVQVIELSDQYASGYIIRKLSTMEKLADPYLHFFKAWKFSPIRRTIKTIKYVPYLRERPIDQDGEFNLFSGFKHKYDPHFKVDMSKIQPWLDYLREIWSDNNETIYQYILHWFAHKVQFPDKKCPTSIVAYSELEGAGKNTWFNFFTDEVIGSQYGILVSTAEKLFKDFNAEYEHTLLICCDEIGRKGAMFSYADQLKAIVTRPFLNVEQKGVDVRRNVPDYNNYIFFSNNRYYIVCISGSDRRNFCIEISNKYAGENSFWNRIYSPEIYNSEVGKHMFHYLATLPFTVDLKNIPNTDWKRELKNNNMDIFLKSLCIFVAHNIDDQQQPVNTENRFQTCELYDIYCQTNQSREHKKGEFLTANAFSAKFHKITGFSKIDTQFVKEGKRCRGYQFTIQDLMDKMRKILKDTDYDFRAWNEEGDETLDNQLVDEN